MLFLHFFVTTASACSAGYSLTRDNEIITDPTFSFQVSPPVRWTYFPPIQFPGMSYPLKQISKVLAGTSIANFFPGQSINSQQALQFAQNDVMASFLEAVADSNYPFTGGQLNAQTTYSPDEISNCYLTQPIPSGTKVGFLAAGAITEISIISGVGGAGAVATTCPLATTQENPGIGPYQEYFKPVSVATRGGFTLTRYQWERVASQMQSILNFRYNALFRSPIVIT